MIYDPKNGNLYDDNGEYLKKISCPFALHPDQLLLINEKERRCNACAKVIYSVDDISDTELREMIVRDEKICLFSTSNAKNIKTLDRHGKIDTNTEGYEPIQTLRSLDSMAAAQKNGFFLLFKDVGSPHAFGEDKFSVYQRNDTGEIWWSGDYRTSLYDKAIDDGVEDDLDAYCEENWTVVRPWFYARRDLPFPLAAYAIPKPLVPGTRVFLPDVIEEVKHVFWNQGNAQRVLSTSATWNGKDLEVDLPGPPAFVG